MRVLLYMMLMASSLALQAGVVEPRGFDDPEREARYKRLIAELRCLVCQNQNLADSDADLAKDLRNQTYSMIEAGKSDEEIFTFMVDRYGDFVLYRPPVKTTTYPLWFGPLILVAVAGVALILLVRRRNLHRPDTQLSEPEQEKLRTLLAESDRDARP